MQKQFKDLAVSQIAMSFSKAEIWIDSNSEHEGPGEDWLQEDRKTSVTSPAARALGPKVEGKWSRELFP